MSETKHGTAGTLGSFVRLFPRRRRPFPDDDLLAIASRMDTPDEVKDGPDAEENMLVPAGYTYLGQFVDHDLTFDTTSSLNPGDASAPTNQRTPNFDLDCVYGAGPDDQPYLFLEDGVTLRLGNTGAGAIEDDVPRVAEIGHGNNALGQGRAIIGDKRNDENSIVAQVQLVFLKFHNRVVQRLASPTLEGRKLFEAARNEVRWTYQRMLVEDYLPRIVEAPICRGFDEEWNVLGDAAYALFPPEKRAGIPLEFAAAAYRFGHSMVRTGYRLNYQTRLPVFTPLGESDKSLTGFQRLPSSHVIDDWGRFFPAASRVDLLPGRPALSNTSRSNDENNPAVRLQFAYKVDPNLVGPLGNLPKRIADFAEGKISPIKAGFEGPALSLLNLRRSNKFNLVSGQSAAKLMGIAPLGEDKLVIREEVTIGREERITFNPMTPFLEHTPLWLYILAEAQRHIVAKWADPAGNNRKPFTDEFLLKGEGARTQLGPVGGQIVMETFYGLLDSDRTSYRNAAPPDWQPMVLLNGSGPVTFSKILDWAGLTPSDGFGV